MDWGNLEATLIENTKGSLLNLPVNSNAIAHEIIACGGPKIDTVNSFWEGLIFG